MSVFTDVQWKPKYILKIELPKVDTKYCSQEVPLDVLKNLKLQTVVVQDPEWENAHFQKMYRQVKEMETSQYIYNDYKDSGFDIYIPNDVVFNHKRTELVNLRMKCACYKINYLVPEEDEFGLKDTVLTPSAYWVMARSSIYKTPFRLANNMGLIDSGYRGNLKVAIDVDQFALTQGPMKLEKGKKLFQICVPTLEPFKVEFVEKLDETVRGEGGHGSTDKNNITYE